MHPNQYRRIRESIGSRKEVAPKLDVHPKHIAAREQGNRPITREAEFALRWLAHREAEKRK